MAWIGNPVLLDRLIDEGRQELAVVVHWDPEVLRERGVAPRDIVRALELIGCRVNFGPIDEFSSVPTTFGSIDEPRSVTARISSLPSAREDITNCLVRFGGGGARLDDIASRIDYAFVESLAPETPQELEASLGEFRDRVLRDLSSLLNTMSLETVDRELSRFPAVRRSVLNYGLRALTGHHSGMVDSDWLAQRIAEAIRSFEPRLKVYTVQAVGTDSEGPAREFRIDAELVQNGGNERLVLNSRFDAQLSRFELDPVV